MRVYSAEELGKLIRQRRKELGINQSKVAAMAGCGVMFVSNLENGKGSSEIDKVIEVMNALGMDFFAVRRGDSPWL